METRRKPIVTPTDADYANLLAFRDGLRRFLSWSEEQAQAAGVTPAQHQLLLAIRGHGGTPSVSDIAAHLLHKHHSVVALIDRAVEAGLVRRVADKVDHRVVRVSLTPTGQRTLERLAAAHLEELSRIGPGFAELWSELPF
jgi:DNA-binding MarR family transcriptional regulator